MVYGGLLVGQIGPVTIGVVLGVGVMVPVGVGVGVAPQTGNVETNPCMNLLTSNLSGSLKIPLLSRSAASN
jgi:hypothetical protein